MVKTELGKKLEPGDKIHCQNLIITVGEKIYYNEYFGERDGFYCEFLVQRKIIKWLYLFVCDILSISN